MVIDASDIRNESDVEQKIIYPLLTQERPQGLGIPPTNIHTKPDIRSFSIEKRSQRRLYYPDYVISIAGLPLLIIEAKSPQDELDEAYREARLYTTELNAEFSSGLNPASKIICTNGRTLIAGFSDSNSPLHSLSIDQLHAADQAFDALLKFVGFSQLQLEAARLSESLTTRPYSRPTTILGGQSVRNEEIGHNSFGASISLEYRHLFNPTTRGEREFIVKHAYIPSRRRERYVDPIDRIIRAAAPPSESDAQLIEDTQSPTIFVNVLRRDRRAIEQQILLLIGGVGSGKSTFVDYLEVVALPEDIRNSTLWVHVNMNNAPLDMNRIYSWLADQIVNELQRLHPEIDFDAFETTEKIYAVELLRLKKRALAILDKESNEYKTRLVDEIIRLQNDPVATAQANTRHLGSERGKLIILILDNCDKRIRDEQLLMFQAAQWLQQQFRCLIILPLRDETYDNHRNEPPLDTALKDLVFRIEPPLFQNVLTRRLSLALKEMTEREQIGNKLEYSLPNGMRVEYPSTKQAFYLTAILKSIFEYDRFIRRMIVGLAGRDIRKAMEIFLEFCTSGYIGEDEIFKITQAEGNYTLPYHIVTRVLLRLNRRFYDSDYSYIKNLFACNPEDHSPNYFSRIAILRWLNSRFNLKGPTGLKGYHPVRELKADLFPIGLTNEIVQRELLYLLRASCIISENLRTDRIHDDDLIKLAPAGSVHLDLLINPDYLAAISEDTWFDNRKIAENIAERIVGDSHYEVYSIVRNSEDLVYYLQKKLQSSFPNPDSFLTGKDWQQLTNITDVAAEVERFSSRYKRDNPWLEVTKHFKVGQMVDGVIDGVNSSHGIFVRLSRGIVGLVHRSKLAPFPDWGSRFQAGDKLQVQIEEISPHCQRMVLKLVDNNRKIQ